jgi:quercetin dioxygenase-like cupin family protein
MSTKDVVSMDPVLLEQFVIDGLPWEDLPAIGEGVRHKVLWRSGSSVAGLMRLARGGFVGPHAHRRAHHHLWVVDGEIEVLAVVLGTGSYVHVPAGVTHSMTNRGDGPATFLYLYLQDPDS